ncbi:DNA-binding protein [Asaia sp. SF2.1]|nr:DNA-binding protein [Asaia sp. SF2.1]
MCSHITKKVKRKVLTDHTFFVGLWHRPGMMEDMGTRLRRLRDASGLGQAEVSAATGIERSYLSKMESKSIPSTWDKMCALADLYDVTLDFLRTGKSVPVLKPGSRIIEDPTEIALVRAWRAMSADERKALGFLVSKFGTEIDGRDSGAA